MTKAGQNGTRGEVYISDMTIEGGQKFGKKCGWDLCMIPYCVIKKEQIFFLS